MATLDRMESLGLLKHRRWEDVLSMILGAAIIVSPLWFKETSMPTMMAVTALVGAAIVVLSGLEQIFLRRWEEILSLFLGIWMMVQPFVFQYGAPLRGWHVAFGAGVAALAILELWQDRNRSLDG
ncbi:SPW repeat domain-containing protein [Aminobacter sp. HY435]|uniref:SPW repeat domain-containing protein n=1 Tax=Aminobacter sp. HY435 TaxID=2970917 RepID=UPI0022B97FA4|nr:hypothetical protein [Aminobacter sp. HY435]